MVAEPAGFNQLIHSPVRLRLCAALATANEIEFEVLERALAITSPTLSKQLRLLQDAELVELERRPQSFGRPHTWVRLTRTGERAYAAHVRALNQIVRAAGAEAADDSVGPRE